jgi:hypothetical protein
LECSCGGIWAFPSFVADEARRWRFGSPIVRDGRRRREVAHFTIDRRPAAHFLAEIRRR